MALSWEPFSHKQTACSPCTMEPQLSWILTDRNVGFNNRNRYKEGKVFKKKRRRKQCWERFCFKYFVSFRYMFHPFSCTYPVLAAWEAPMANLGWPVNLACISLDCGRRLECLERTNTGRTHKSHSKMVQIKTQDLLSVRQEGGNHHSVRTISLFFTYNLL